MRAWNRKMLLQQTATVAALAYNCGYSKDAIYAGMERSGRLFNLLDSGKVEDSINMVCINREPETPTYYYGMNGYV